MDNDELQELVKQKGLENDIIIKGSDLQRLLDIQMPYDFIRKFVQEMAAIDFDTDKVYKFEKEQDKVLDLVWDHAFRGYITVEIKCKLMDFAMMIGRAKILDKLYSKSSWETE